ncbi:MAG: glycosyltransferase [Desulfovibrio sp.]|nr:glycosyltransferase [Desulfovibrio sp.]
MECPHFFSSDHTLLVFLHGDPDRTCDLASQVLSECPNARPVVFCEARRKPGAFSDRVLFVPYEEKTGWHGAANAAAALLAKNYADAWLLLFDASFAPLEGSLQLLGGHIVRDGVAAAAPLLLTEDMDDHRKKRVLSSGLAVEPGLFLRSLHEGLGMEDPLLERCHSCQLAVDDVLLLPLASFMDVSGYSPALDENLRGLDLTLKLTRTLHGHILTDPRVRAVHPSPFHFLARTGLWNSYAQRGKISPSLLEPDIGRLYTEDGLSLHADAWLSLVPGHTHEEGEENGEGGDSPGRRWRDFRRSESPGALVRFLKTVPPDLRQALFEEVRPYPYYMPRTAAWYGYRSGLLLKYASEEGLSPLEEDVGIWKAGASRFREKTLLPAMRCLRDLGFYAGSLDMLPSSYDAWQELVEPDLPPAFDVRVERTFPTISVLMPLYNPDPRYLEAAIDSIRSQTYPRWELCAADDASTDPESRDFIETMPGRDTRIRVTKRTENGHISRATNTALSMSLAPFAACMDQDDLLAGTALEESVHAFLDHPNVRIVYTDEDRIDMFGVRRTPTLKFGYDVGHGTGHLSSFTTEFLRKLGGLRPGFEGSQDFDLALRALESVGDEGFWHIPRVLYHWRIHEGSTAGSIASKPYALDARKKALIEHYARAGLEGTLVKGPRRGAFSFCMDPVPEKSISLVLCDNGKMDAALMKSLPSFGNALTEVFWLPCQKEGRPPRLLSAFLHSHMPGTGLTALPFEPGFGGLLRAALEGTADILFVLSTSLVPDAECRPDQLAWRAAQRDVAFVGGYHWHRGKALDLGGFPDQNGLPALLGRGLAKDCVPDILAYYMCFTHRSLGGLDAAFSFAVPRLLFRDLGGFSDEFGCFAQTDFVLRAEQRGWKGFSTPWGSWEVRKEVEGKNKGVCEQRFLEKWGETVRRHPLRHPLLGSVDFGLGLALGE